MKLYPIMANIENAQVTVIGAGEVALRKVQDLCDAGALVKVIAPEMLPEFKALHNVLEDRLTLVEREYVSGDLAGSVLVFSATNDIAVSKAVFEEAASEGLLINAVDDPPNCSFFVPSFRRAGDFILAVSTSGASPAFAARMCRELEDYLPERIEEALVGLRQVRTLLKTDADFAELDVYDRGKLLSKIANDDALLDLLAGAVEDDTVKDFITFMIQK